VKSNLFNEEFVEAVKSIEKKNPTHPGKKSLGRRNPFGR
jgi:hypothetical protein